MRSAILQLICSFLGAIGFALIFNIKIKRLLPASIGALLCWGIYLLFTRLLHTDIFIATLCAASFGALYSELLARIFKAPTTVFLIPTVIALVPGSSLFYTMQSAVSADWKNCLSYGLNTILYIGGIALGISIISAIFAITKVKKGEK